MCSPGQVEAHALRPCVQKLIEGKRVLVLGSAPNPLVPSTADFDTLVCINGSPRVAASFGLTPHISLLGNHNCLASTPVAVACLSSLQYLRTEVLLYFDVYETHDSPAQILSRIKFQYDDLVVLSRSDRSAIVANAIGLSNYADVPEVSHGIVAACLAACGGAEQIILAGISLSGGHSYIRSNTPRRHIADDTEVLRALGELFHGKMATTNPDLARTTGLRPVFGSELSIPLTPKIATNLRVRVNWKIRQIFSKAKKALIGFAIGGLHFLLATPLHIAILERLPNFVDF